MFLKIVCNKDDFDKSLSTFSIKYFPQFGPQYIDIYKTAKINI